MTGRQVVGVATGATAAFLYPLPAAHTASSGIVALVLPLT